jgi:hypothetical protein
VDLSGLACAKIVSFHTVRRIRESGLMQRLPDACSFSLVGRAVDSPILEQRRSAPSGRVCFGFPRCPRSWIDDDIQRNIVHDLRMATILPVYPPGLSVYISSVASKGDCVIGDQDFMC